MARLKLYKKGKIDWGNVAKQGMRDAAKKNKQRQRARETERKKALKEAEKLQKARQREELRAAKAAEKERVKQEKLAAKEQAVKEKHLLRLNGLFLEHDIPTEILNFDVKGLAYDFEKDNGLSTNSQFKKVTLPWIEDNLWSYLRPSEVETGFTYLKNYLTDIVNELKLEGKETDIFLESEKIKDIEKIILDQCEKLIPSKKNIQEIKVFENPINSERVQKIVNKHLDVKLLASEIKIISEANEIFESTNELIEGIKDIGMQSQQIVEQDKEDIESIKLKIKNAWFKSKFVNRGKDLFKKITDHLLLQTDKVISFENTIKIFKYANDEDQYINQLKNDGRLSKILDRSKKLYAALLKVYELSLNNLVMAADFFESETGDLENSPQGRTLVLEESRETLLAHKFKSKDGELSESKNLPKIIKKIVK